MELRFRCIEFWSPDYWIKIRTGPTVICQQWLTTSWTFKCKFMQDTHLRIYAFPSQTLRLVRCLKLWSRPIQRSFCLWWILSSGKDLSFIESGPGLLPRTVDSCRRWTFVEKWWIEIWKHLFWSQNFWSNLCLFFFRQICSNWFKETILNVTGWQLSTFFDIF